MAERKEDDLIQAVVRNSLSDVRSLLSEMAQEFVNHHLFDPTAATAGGVPIDINYKSQKFVGCGSALFLASMYGFVDIVKELLAYGIATSNALRRRVRERCYEIDEVERGARDAVPEDLSTVLDVNGWGGDGYKALHIAVQKRNFEIIRLLVEVGGADIFHPTPIEGTTPFHEAARLLGANDDTTTVAEDIFEYLILAAGKRAEQGKAHEADTCELECSPIIAHPRPTGANKAGKPYFVTPAPSAKGNAINPTPISPQINTVTAHGRTALHDAILAHSVKNVRTLIECGCDVNIADKGSWTTPLHLAVSTRYHRYTALPMVEALLAAGADPNSQTTNNYNDKCATPLHVAATSTNPVETALIIKALIGAGASTEIVNGEGLTPLHIAAKSSHEDAVSALIECGADPIAKVPHKDDIPIHPLRKPISVSDEAFEEERLKTSEQAEKKSQLLSFLSDMTGGGMYGGKTPLHFAVGGSSHKIVEDLVDCAGADLFITDSVPPKKDATKTSSKAQEVTESRGADNTKDNNRKNGKQSEENGRTALQTCASSGGNVISALWLLTQMAMVSKPTSGTTTEEKEQSNSSGKATNNPFVVYFSQKLNARELLGDDEALLERFADRARLIALHAQVQLKAQKKRFSKNGGKEGGVTFLDYYNETQIQPKSTENTAIISGISTNEENEKATMLVLLRRSREEFFLAVDGGHSSQSSAEDSDGGSNDDSEDGEHNENEAQNVGDENSSNEREALLFSAYLAYERDRREHQRKRSAKRATIAVEKEQKKWSRVLQLAPAAGLLCGIDEAPLTRSGTDQLTFHYTEIINACTIPRDVNNDLPEENGDAKGEDTDDNNNNNNNVNNDVEDNDDEGSGVGDVSCPEDTPKESGMRRISGDDDDDDDDSDRSSSRFESCVDERDTSIGKWEI